MAGTGTRAGRALTVTRVPDYRPAAPAPDDPVARLTRARQMLDANSDPACVGVIAWMHTFSPAKMWISGLDALRKPLLHLHTQANQALPWAEIDMDFMNLNQAAHGDREFGYIQSRLGVARKTVAGHATDRYIITVGPSETESFNAPSLVPPIEPGEMMRFQSLANPMMKAAHKMAAEMQKIKGMTLASSTTVKVMGKTFTTSKEATEVKTGPVPPGAFDIPAGYKKVNSPLTKGR